MGVVSTDIPAEWSLQPSTAGPLWLPPFFMPWFFTLQCFYCGELTDKPPLELNWVSVHIYHSLFGEIMIAFVRQQKCTNAIKHMMLMLMCCLKLGTLYTNHSWYVLLKCPTQLGLSCVRDGSQLRVLLPRDDHIFQVRCLTSQNPCGWETPRSSLAFIGK